MGTFQEERMQDNERPFVTKFQVEQAERNIWELLHDGRTTLEYMDKDFDALIEFLAHRNKVHQSAYDELPNWTQVPEQQHQSKP